MHLSVAEKIQRRVKTLSWQVHRQYIICGSALKPMTAGTNHCFQPHQNFLLLVRLWCIIYRHLLTYQTALNIHFFRIISANVFLFFLNHTISPTNALERPYHCFYNGSDVIFSKKFLRLLKPLRYHPLPGLTLWLWRGVLLWFEIRLLYR